MSKKELTMSEKIKKFRYSIVAIILVATLCATSIVAVASAAYSVDVVVDGKKSTVSTVRTSANGVLAQADVTIDENDIVDTSNFTAWETSTITVTKRYAVSIIDGSKQAIKAVSDGTVADALHKAGITIDSADKLNHKLSTQLTEGMTIKIIRAFTVSIVSEDKVMPVKVTGGTVADALKKAGVTLSSSLKLGNCETDDTLSAFMIIELIPVRTKKRVVNTKIAYKTIKKNSSSLIEGETEVYRKGQVGTKTTTYLDTYEGKKLVSSEELSSEVTKEPVNKIILVGTAKSPLEAAPAGSKLAKNVPAASELTVPSDLIVDKNNVPLSYRYKATGSATAYYAPVGSLTASGRTVIPGHIAVNPNQFPYGTKLWVVATNGYVYGYSIAADTGGFVAWGNTLCDLFFWTYDECCNWGRHDVTIYAL